MTRRLVVWVPGHPRTKGSLKPIRKPGGGVRLVEQVAMSKPWRVQISNTIIRVIAEKDGDMGGWRLKEGWPMEGGVNVGLVFRFDRAGADVGQEGGWPISRSLYGDSDKLTRNVLDAMQDAQVYRDDAQVVELSVSKVFAEGPFVAGVGIHVCEA